MKRRLSILFILIVALGVPFAAHSQNNNYEIDDDCYRMFLEAEALYGGKPGFKEKCDELLKTAIARNDRKAEVFYYILKVKDLTRTQVPKDGSAEERMQAVLALGEQMMSAHEELKRISLETGYPQYFFYSYQLTKNFFFNNGMKLKALELVQEMQRKAVEMDNAYGKWVSDKEMASLYSALRDKQTARKYLASLLYEYENTKDPIIRKQTMCNHYVDYATTFPPAHDSVLFYLQKAASCQVTPQDSVRCNYVFAQYYAAKGDKTNYVKYRDLCKQSQYLESVFKASPSVLNTLDAILDGKGEQVRNSAMGLPASMIRIAAAAAEKSGDLALSNYLKEWCINDSESFFSRLNDLHLTEMEARYGNTLLSADLAAKSRQVEIITVIIAILLLLILAGIILTMSAHIRNLKKSNAKDEKQIAEFKEANERVRMANEAKTRFVQNMSHEVRTPLNAIVGFSQLLSLPDGTFSEEEKDEYAGHIVNNTKMLTMLLDDILNASAMDKGNYSITYEQSEKDFLCEAAISSAEHRLQPGVKMYYAPEDAPHNFITDPRRVQQILINLLTNACKHTTQGEIKLSSSLNANPGFVTFTVTDTGTGVPPEKAEVIFERFSKLNDFVQGTGLGLSICRDIATRMGAEVYLDTSYPGPGAQFVFKVPESPSTTNDNK
ncbi:MAG: HAMP domain-containing histidine kinase [Bacteroidales bacterium]|nr:HAMP domain-containing histidine kinase [Bacteroidales bacterium]